MFHPQSEVPAEETRQATIVESVKSFISGGFGGTAAVLVGALLF
jgi:hypothetical protein